MFFLLLDPFFFSNPITFFFLFILNNLKLHRSATWSCRNHFWTLIITEQHTKKFLGVWESVFVVFGDLFFEFWAPCILRGCNFLISNSFLTIVSVSDGQGFQFCLDNRNNRALPLDPACPENLSVWSPAGLSYVHGKTTKKQDFGRFIPDQFTKITPLLLDIVSLLVPVQLL